MDIRYRIRSFGSPAVEGPDGPLGGCAAQRQALALLTIVAAAGERGLSRDKIIALLWPEADARRAGHRLSQLLHSLRRSLGEDSLVASAGEIRVNPDRMTSDVAEFNTARSRGALDRAAACYSGPFMDGFYLGDAPEFERWVESERAAFDRAYGEALETLAIAAEASGDRATASRWWSLLAAHEPLSSRVIMRLMSALAAYGDRAGALHHAQRYEVGVERELEAVPNPAVLALAERLRQTAIASASLANRRFSIAVSPILNLSSAPGNDYLAEGLVEELTNSLSRQEGVRLVAVPSVEGISRASLDGILEGSIRQADDRIRVILRLVDPKDGSYVWSQRYERQLESVFELQDELTEAILQDMRPVLHR